MVGEIITGIFFLIIIIIIIIISISSNNRKKAEREKKLKKIKEFEKTVESFKNSRPDEVREIILNLKRQKEEADKQAKLKIEQEEAKRIKKLQEELKYEIVVVVFASVDDNGKPTAILKRNNNTYSFVERESDEFILGNLKLLRETTEKLVWVDESEYAYKIEIEQQKIELKKLQEKIIGTKWKVSLSESDYQDDDIWDFFSNGFLKYSRSKYSQKWELKNQQLIISFNDGYAIYTGQISDNEISGTAQNILGEKWTFKGERINNSVDERILTERKKEESFTNSDNPNKVTDERQRLNALLAKRTNWQDFQRVLLQNGITTLYHFTDRENIASIKEYGGLYSWDYCDKNDIVIPYQGGDSLSKELDMRYSLQDYVRLSFVRNHPMMFVALNKGRLQDPVILTISLDVCYFAETRFANMNATKTGHRQGKNIDDLQAIHFNTVKQLKHFDLDESEKPYFQAEILVKTWIPIKHITNINLF